ncbi:DNA recombination protein RmuC [Roseateles sp. BYS180W]|uniref:DNA recombination protein RmuC n=1 Tax=Roseateles rivi TaxID=3299028 RepID=A0ABW7FYL8_9BURK
MTVIEMLMLGGLAVVLVLVWWNGRRQQMQSEAPVTAEVLAQQAQAVVQLLGGPLARLERELRDEMARGATQDRQELLGQLVQFQQTLLTQGEAAARTQNEHIHHLREQQAQALQRLADALTDQLRTQSQSQVQSQTEMRQSMEQRLTQVQVQVDQRLAAIQQDNEKKLEQMRATVDEKLHATLEQRLGESFKHVADRLEQVHKGLGEMHVLARDVGSLNRVLNNVKTRGIFGEVQLAALLEQVFTPEQYAANVATVPGSSERVEFAIKLPGAVEGGVPLWLPIDAKFPREDYERLLDAQERADLPAAEAAGKALELRLRLEARTIREKYIAPPHTTDFAMLFVPTEGLYAEALRRPGLVESLQREFKLMLVGPTTLLATLNSLQMGFRTLALQKRSAEVWEVLGAVKTEFDKFGEVLAKTKKKLAEASNTIEAAERRARVMGRQLKSVEAMPGQQAQQLLGLDDEPDALPESDAD